MRLNKQRPTTVTTTVIAGVIATGILGACGAETSGSQSADSSAPTILASTSVWADVVANVACDGLATVETIIPVGADPHAFEPSLASRAAMDDAALIVTNGLGLESGLDDTIGAAAEGGTPVLRIAEHVDTIEFASLGLHDEDEHDEDEHSEDEHSEDEHDEDEHSEDEHSDHDHGDLDPHVWFDPVRVAAVLPELSERLVEDAGLDADRVATCSARYEEQLLAIDAEIEEMTSPIGPEQRKLVTSHDALGYFADRYGFEIIGTIIPVPSGLAETNPAQLQELATVVEENGVPAVFAETQRSSDDADALASQVGGVEVVTLLTGSLGQPGSDSATYIGFLRTNAQLITDALSG